jgi:hypothetical protein
VPVPPVWVGGTSLPALRRAVKFGDGWLSAQVASQLVRYVEAGADLIVVVCDPAPSPGSWELLADVRRLLLTP